MLLGRCFRKNQRLRQAVLYRWDIFALKKGGACGVLFFSCLDIALGTNRRLRRAFLSRVDTVYGSKRRPPPPPTVPRPLTLIRNCGHRGKRLRVDRWALSTL